jgi:hypothetical protein
MLFRLPSEPLDLFRGALLVALRIGDGQESLMDLDVVETLREMLLGHCLRLGDAVEIEVCVHDDDRVQRAPGRHPVALQVRT